MVTSTRTKLDRVGTCDRARDRELALVARTRVLVCERVA